MTPKYYFCDSHPHRVMHTIQYSIVHDCYNNTARPKQYEKREAFNVSHRQQ